MTRLNVLQVCPEKLLQEVVKVKPKLQHRTQNADEVKTMGCLLRKATGMERS